MPPKRAGEKRQRLQRLDKKEAPGQGASSALRLWALRETARLVSSGESALFALQLFQM